MQQFVMEAWYVVHAKTRQERLAAEHLTRQHYHVYLPLLRTPKRRRDHWRDVIEPLFPGYLFIRVDLHLQNTAPIRSTHGVLGLVRFGGEPKPVPIDLVEYLLAAETDPEGTIRQEHLFQSGDRVEIASGPLAGLKGIFLAASGQERAHLLLDLLGRSNRVVVSQHQLLPVS
jgi:transcriptional antiterminator RfaH